MTSNESESPGLTGDRIDRAGIRPGSADAALLKVEGLVVRYRTRRGYVEAVRGVDLSVDRGETVALVGESGSGKSTTALAVVGLLPAAADVISGAIGFRGRDLRQISRRERRGLLGRRISMIPQDPTVSLNPVKRIGDQVAEVLRIHHLADKQIAFQEGIAALAAAGIDQPEARARQYPHELSGGMRQRVLIAIAMVSDPSLIIADEPTSALDVTVQKQILDNIDELTQAAGTGVLLVTHDLGVAADRADRIVVMKDGRIVEAGVPQLILNDPRHQYTKSLIAAAPSLSSDHTPVRTDTTSARRHRRPPAPRTDPDAESATSPILRTRGLVKDFAIPGGHRRLRAVDEVSLSIPRGRTLALVGESGSGKSTTARLALRLIAPTSGRVEFDGQDVTELRGEPLRQLRRRVQLVSQNPYASLNPRLSVARVIAEPLLSFGAGRRDGGQRASELVDLVALSATVLDRRPAELSGGQRQRVAIARALALQPDLVVLDEPVSALDVRVQAQILQLLADIQAELNVAYLFISHDLAVVRQVAHQVGVMLRGKLVETGPATTIFDDPQDAYTRELLSAIPGRRIPVSKS